MRAAWHVFASSYTQFKAVALGMRTERLTEGILERIPLNRSAKRKTTSSQPTAKVSYIQGFATRCRPWHGRPIAAVFRNGPHSPADREIGHRSIIMCVTAGENRQLPQPDLGTGSQSVCFWARLPGVPLAHEVYLIHAPLDDPLIDRWRIVTEWRSASGKSGSTSILTSLHGHAEIRDLSVRHPVQGGNS